MTATPAWLAAIEALLNRGIAGSVQAAALADRLEATVIRVEVRGMTAVHAGIAAGRLGLIAVEASDGAADTPAACGANATISGSPLALLQLARGGSADRGSTAAAQVRGDAEVANAYRQLFAAARPDLEEELSRIVGDFPARGMTRLAGRTLAWARKARRIAGENVAEYLQEESRDLVNRTELDEFLQGVDSLRDTADRVAARLARLERREKGSP
jgi:ubiquinone biosynthesis protein UbiJ